MSLDVVVTDKAGKPVSGLSQNDFSLLDNNLPGKILSFQATDLSAASTGGAAAASSEQAQVFLILDTVNLSHNEVTDARVGLAKFLRMNGGHLAMPVTILIFSYKGIEAQLDPTTDGNALATQVDNFGTRYQTITDSAGIWGETERYDLSVNTLMNVVHQAKSISGKKLLIWIGPGWPMLDQLNVDMNAKSVEHIFTGIVTAATELREAHITLSSVSLGTPNQTTYLYRSFLKGVKVVKKANYSNLGVKVLAIQSGGRVVGPDNDLASQIDKCVSDASVFYTISFDAPRADGANEYHELKIQLGKQDLTARTNAVYYNQP